MRSIVTSSVLVLCVLMPSLAVAQSAPAGPAPAPVTLPEEPEQDSAASPKKDAAAPAPAKDAPAAAPAKDFAPPASSGTKASPAQTAPVPAAQAPAPPAAPVAPPPYIYGAAPPSGPAAAPAPITPNADSVAEKPKGPVHSRFNAAVNWDSVWYTGKSFDFFSEQNNATSPGVSIGYAILMDEPISLVPELGWSTNKVSQENLFGGAISHTELRTHNAYGGLSFRVGILSFLEAHARVAAGASFLKASLRTGTESTEFATDGISPYATAGGGVTLHSPSRTFETQNGSLRSLVAGVTLEGGYQLGGSLDITPTPTGDTGRIPTTYMSFGVLERSGPYVRTSLVLRF
jgi:hypothetical protein